MSDREAAGSADRVGSRGEQRRGRGGGILRAITRMVTRSQAAATTIRLVNIVNLSPSMIQWT